MILISLFFDSVIDLIRSNLPLFTGPWPVVIKPKIAIELIISYPDMWGIGPRRHCHLSMTVR